MSQMNNEELRVKCAEELGWKWYRRPATGPWADKPHRTLYHPQLVPETVKKLQLADMTERECNSAFIFREGLIGNYPESLDACKELIEFARKSGQSVTIQFFTSGRCSCRINDAFECVEETPALAICKAFLRWKGML